MAVTGSCDETIFAKFTEIEPDYDRAIMPDELVDALDTRSRTLDRDQRVDVDVSADDIFKL